MFRQFLILISLLFALFDMAQAAPSQQTTELSPFDFRTDPVLQVASYYNAINLQDFVRAYNYWETAPRNATLAQFTAGFANTERVAAFVKLPVFVNAGAGNLYAEVPVLLAAGQTNSSPSYFSGCITTHKVNVPVGNATEPDPNWWLRSGNLAQTTTFDVNLLETACDQTNDSQGSIANLLSPVELMQSYFNAIENRDYARAYSYWESPPLGQTLAQFTNGFATTMDVSVILRLDIFAGAAAGSGYASLPTLIMATQTDGSIQYYGGCYVARKSNVPVGDAIEPDPNWHLYSADVSTIPSISDGLGLLDGVCA